MMHYRTIDMNTYPRRAHFDYFRSPQKPMLDVDAAALRAACSQRSSIGTWTGRS